MVVKPLNNLRLARRRAASLIGHLQSHIYVITPSPSHRSSTTRTIRHIIVQPGRNGDGVTLHQNLEGLFMKPTLLVETPIFLYFYLHPLCFHHSPCCLGSEIVCAHRETYGPLVIFLPCFKTTI